MKKDTRFLILVFGMAGVPGTVLAQATYNVAATANTVIKVLGTSNLHDWSMETKMTSGTAKFVFPAAGDEPQSLTALDITLTVKDLKSGESLMDSRAYTALKADKYNSVSFTLVSASIIPGQGGQFGLKSTGNLSIAGTTKLIAINAACQVNADGTITCSGTEPVKMSDYQIKPPTFMLGALRTGDALTINFSLVFKNNDMNKVVKAGLITGLVLLVFSVAGLYGTIWLFPKLAVQYYDPTFDTPSGRYMLYYIHPFVIAMALSWFWQRFKGVLKGSFLTRGIEFGVIYGVVALLPMMLLIYSAIDVSLTMVATWLLFGLLQGIVGGLVLEKMNP